MSKFKLLLANGDSYAAGTDTALPSFYPEMGDTYSVRDKPPHSWKTFRRFDKLSRDSEYHDRYLEACLENSFPAQLGKKLNLETLNLSLGGQSNSSMAAITIAYIEHILKFQYKLEDILVVLNLTGFQRLKIPVRKPFGRYRYDCGNVMLGHIQPTNKELLTIFQNTSDKFLVLENFIAITALIKFLETYNISYIFTDSHLYTFDKQVLCDKEFDSGFLDLFPTVDEPCIMKNLIQPEARIFHILGHYTTEFYTKFSDMVCDYIVDKFKDKF